MHLRCRCSNLRAGDVGFLEESGRNPLRAGSGGDRRGDRSPRHHHLRQRQVLRDLAILARRAARPGSSHRELRAPSRSSCGTSGARLHTAACGEERSATAPRTGPSTGSIRRSCRFSTAQGKPRQYLAIRYEITARKHAEAQLREQAALAQLGQLAAVVAHEVRNPLAGLRASLQVIDRRCEPRDRSAIAAMIQRIDGLNDKVEDLLLYARPSRPAGSRRRQSADARRGRQCANEHRPSRVDLQFLATNARALADPEMLRAALLNLPLNACQAAGTRKSRSRSTPATACAASPSATAAPGFRRTFATACSSRSLPRGSTEPAWVWRS